AVLEVDKDQMNVFEMPLSSLVEGVVEIYVDAASGMTDLAGNAPRAHDADPTTNNSFTFTYDVTGPQVSIASQITPLDNEVTPEIQLNITDNVAVDNPNWVYIGATATIDDVAEEVFISFDVDGDAPYTSAAIGNVCINHPLIDDQTDCEEAGFTWGEGTHFKFTPANGTAVTLFLASDVSGAGLPDGIYNDPAGDYNDLTFRFFDRAMNEMDSDGDTEGIQPLKTEQFEIDTEAPGIAAWTVTGVTSETVIEPNGYYNGNNGDAEHVQIEIVWDDDIEDETFELDDFIDGFSGNVIGATAYDLVRVTASQYRLLLSGL
ncbi:uncharacterized protein METZ01_LOCUS353167, partial [marine metagenome]